MKVIVKGYSGEIRPVSFLAYVAKLKGGSVERAKNLLDEIVDGNTIEFEFVEQGEATFCYRKLSSLGFICAIEQ